MNNVVVYTYIKNISMKKFCEMNYISYLCSVQVVGNASKRCKGVTLGKATGRRAPLGNGVTYYCKAMK